MRRRDFMKSGLLSVASVSAFGGAAPGQAPTQGSYVEGQRCTLTNKFLDWELVMTGGTIQSADLRNKLSGRYYNLRDSREVLVTFSRAKSRIELPWWYVAMGPDNDKSQPEQERGYLGATTWWILGAKRNGARLSICFFATLARSRFHRFSMAMPGSGRRLNCQVMAKETQSFSVWAAITRKIGTSIGSL